MEGSTLPVTIYMYKYANNLLDEKGNTMHDKGDEDSDACVVSFSVKEIGYDVFMYTAQVMVMTT